MGDLQTTNVALIIMAVNLIVDVLYAVINPRIRHS